MYELDFGIENSELVKMGIFALCCNLNFELFGITKYIRYLIIYQRPNIFSIQPILTIRENTDPPLLQGVLKKTGILVQWAIEGTRSGLKTKVG